MVLMYIIALQANTFTVEPLSWDTSTGGCDGIHRVSDDTV